MCEWVCAMLHSWRCTRGGCTQLCKGVGCLHQYIQASQREREQVAAAPIPCRGSHHETRELYEIAVHLICKAEAGMCTVVAARQQCRRHILCCG